MENTYSWTCTLLGRVINSTWMVELRQHNTRCNWA